MPSYLNKAADLVTRTIAAETIIVPVRAHVADLESIYSTDAVGTLIWQLIDGQTTVAQIVDAVCAIYEVANDQARRDVGEFIAALQTEGLVLPTDNKTSERPR